MRKIYQSHNLVFLLILESKLQHQGIQCFIKNQNPPLAGELPSIVAPPELWIINDQSYNIANSILNEELITKTNPADPWQCPKCNELLEGYFDVCWKCGSGKN